MKKLFNSSLLIKLSSVTRNNSIYPALLTGLLFFACNSDTVLMSDETNAPSLKGGVGKVEICHYDKITGEYETLSVAVSSTEWHIAHGDYMGLCNPDTDGDGVIDDLDLCPDTPEGEEVDQNGCSLSNPVYWDSNGVTVKARDWAQVGQTGILNDITYTIVDEAMLRQMAVNGDDVTKVCTTKVTNMSSSISSMFANSSFNQDISSWDVSNVADMRWMFANTPFNQDISSWDVSNVTTMDAMFLNTPFNQDISSWDVGNVTSMLTMFSNTPFNQDISSWDVGNVTSMGGMFKSTPFNQPIGNWNVSNVLYMNSMFDQTPFNQPIGNWNISKVINMGGMFALSQFNQDISNWDVSNVTTMGAMFASCTQFNQDLSGWMVDNVTSCLNFSFNTPLWTLPKPNFTNCTP